MTRATLPRASAAETAGFVNYVALPLVARGVIKRRERVTGVLDRLDGDTPVSPFRLRFELARG
jgi:hypothetical protein